MKEMDFDNDIKSEIVRISNEVGIKISQDQTVDSILISYLTVRLKLIETSGKKILVNPEFLFQIPDHVKRNEIENIISIAKCGGDINAFQSDRLLQTNFHDHLLNEWNIDHLHLTMPQTIKNKKLKKGNHLMFVYADNEYLIFLGTDTHKKGIFADTIWIAILQKYFPKTIEGFKLKDVTEISPKVNSIERQALWDKGFSLGMTKVNNIVYVNPGGRMTSGHNPSVIKAAHEIIRWKHTIYEQVVNSFKEICAYLTIDETQLKLKLRMGKKHFELFDEYTNTIILTYPEILIEQAEILEKI